MSTTMSKRFGLNRIEKTIIYSVIFGVILLATVNVVWLASLFGIHITTVDTQKILDAVNNGATLGGAFAAILGVTLPGWEIAAAGALALTNA